MVFERGKYNFTPYSSKGRRGSVAAHDLQRQSARNLRKKNSSRLERTIEDGIEDRKGRKLGLIAQ